MTKALSEDEKAIRAYERAIEIATTALEGILKLHISYKEEKGLTACSLCFKSWECETYKLAEEALNKMKGQLPR